MKRPVTVRPSATWVGFSAGSCAWCTFLVRRAASLRALVTAGSRLASASWSACCGTTVVCRSTWSKRTVYSRTAGAPRRRTSSQTGRTRATAASTSVAARGRTPARAARLSWPGSRPRRSIREITRLVYGRPGFLRLPVTARFPARFPARSLGGPAGARLGQQDDARGAQRPEGQRALGPQGERGAEGGPGRAGREQVVVGSQPDFAADPQGDKPGGDRARDQADGGRRAGPADQDPVAEGAGDQPADGGDQGEPGVGHDERGGFRVHQSGFAVGDLLQQRARRDRGPDEPGRDAEYRAARQSREESRQSPLRETSLVAPHCSRTMLPGLA